MVILSLDLGYITLLNRFLKPYFLLILRFVIDFMIVQLCIYFSSAWLRICSFTFTSCAENMFL